MIWVILAILGVPIWLCAVAILVLLLRNRSVRHREGDVPVRRRPAGKNRWARGHGLWVHDVFSYRSSPAAWSESITWVSAVTGRDVADEAEAKKLRRLGPSPVVAVMATSDGDTIEFATSAERGHDLFGPFAPASSALLTTSPG